MIETKELARVWLTVYSLFCSWVYTIKDIAISTGDGGNMSSSLFFLAHIYSSSLIYFIKHPRNSFLWLSSWWNPDEGRGEVINCWYAHLSHPQLFNSFTAIRWWEQQRVHFGIHFFPSFCLSGHTEAALSQRWREAWWERCEAKILHDSVIVVWPVGSARLPMWLQQRLWHTARGGNYGTITSKMK